MKGLHATLITLILLISMPLLAAEPLSVYSGREVFGLAPSASPKMFSTRLGQPTAELPMSNGRRGLLYGNSLLLVFDGQTLREVRCWRVEQFSSPLFAGWLQEVQGSKPQVEGFLLDDQVRLGMLREQLDAFRAGLEGSGDERSDVLIKNGSQVWLGYGRAPDYHFGDDSEQWVLVSISVSFATD